MTETKTNSYGPPPWFRSFMSRHLECLYEDSSGLNNELVAKIAELFQVRPENIILAHSRDELRSALLQSGLDGEVSSVDDTFLEFKSSPQPSSKTLRLRSLTALFSVPGLNLVMALSAAETIAQLKPLFSSASLNSLSQKFCLEALRDEDYLSKVFKALHKKKSQPKRTAKKAHSLMIQGTASNAGKSILTAAFCRILLQDGVNVAPFKSQNMSLNSYVTHDGLEIARAQVVQAQAARLDPDIRMSPILLKPSADTESQIIINGKAVEHMSWQGYTNYKERAFEQVQKSYDSLADEYDAIILEGAGSPAEVNLKQNDIVNLGMARYAKAPVLVAGDIDRGGVYASFVGTMEVLLPWERELICGFLVNRFRGDASLLGDAHDFVEYHTGKPVVGVIPYLHDLGLPEEDDISFKVKSEKTSRVLDIVLIGLPKISNFTDVDAFDVEDDVSLRIVRRVEDIGSPDCLILPGSKSTVSDLQHIKNNGIADKIITLAHSGDCQIVGICGGFQMLGQSIADVQAVESSISAIEGLALLDTYSEMMPQKTLRQQKLGNDIEGYEIHHGKTTVGSSKVIMASGDEILGVENNQGNVWGTYLHGLFDNDVYRFKFINKLRLKKGVEVKSQPTVYNLEPAFDRLADAVRTGVDMDMIYKMMKL